MVDYSKWKTIEVTNLCLALCDRIWAEPFINQISDDEDDTHPNIDTASLFRWRHQARLERMAELEQSKKEVTSKKVETEKQLQQLSKEAANSDDKELKEKLKKLEIEQKELEEKEKEIEKKEKSLPWNVDTISKEGWSKTIINKPTPKVDRSKMSEEELEQLYKDFVAKNEKKIKHFGLLSKAEDCKQYLMANQALGMSISSASNAFAN